jgi:hypothetical protein
MKLNQEQLQAVLADIYVIDASLRQYEAELEKIIQQIVEFKPEANFDENFRQQLKNALLEKAGKLQAVPKRVFGSLIFGGKFSYAMAGVLALAIIVVGAGYFAQKQGVFSFQFKKLINFQPSQQSSLFKRIALKDGAFGNLISTSSSMSAPTGEKAFDSSGIGGGVAMGSAPKVGSAVSEPAVIGRGGDGMVMPMFYYRYAYKGEPLNLAENTIEVLRRVGFNQDASGFGSLLGGLGAIDIGSFSNLKVQNINLAEDRDRGYILSCNIEEGRIDIWQNWFKWPQAYAVCQGETVCLDQKRLEVSDVPSDEQIINIAKDFVQTHGINLSVYGDPFVVDNWRAAYAAAEDKSQFYIFEETTVTFPLKVNGQDVYDESGNKTGINVSINLRERNVSGASSITSQAYEASNYAAEIDASKILQVVEQGGVWGYGYYPSDYQLPEGMRQLTVEVGTPERGYLLTLNYNNNQTNYLLVPALIFPIIKTPDGQNYYYQKNIIVPLAKDLLANRLVPMPMMTK